MTCVAEVKDGIKALEGCAVHDVISLYNIVHFKTVTSYELLHHKQLHVSSACDLSPSVQYQSELK